MKPTAKVRVGKDLSEMFRVRNVLKQGDALSPLLFNFALEYAIRRVQVIQDGMKLNGKHQLLVYADVNILGGSVHTVKENAEALIVASKEKEIQVSADETRYMVMSRDQNDVRECLLSFGAESFFSPTMLSKIIKTKTYRTRVFPVVLYGCETWSLTLRGDRRPWVFDMAC